MVSSRLDIRPSFFVLSCRKFCLLFSMVQNQSSSRRDDSQTRDPNYEPSEASRSTCTPSNAFTSANPVQQASTHTTTNIAPQAPESSAPKSPQKRARTSVCKNCKSKLYAHYFWTEDPPNKKHKDKNCVECRWAGAIRAFAAGRPLSEETQLDLMQEYLSKCHEWQLTFPVNEPRDAVLERSECFFHYQIQRLVCSSTS